MNVPVRGFLAIVAVAIAIVAWLSVDVRARLMFTDQYGHIESGSLLGASIGDSWDIADRALQRHISADDVLWLSGENIQQGGGTMSGRTSSSRRISRLLPRSQLVQRCGDPSAS